MRITQKLLYSQAMVNIQSNQQDLYKTQEQMITGKRINHPSDDPLGASRLLGLKKNLSRLDQFQRNIDQADGFLHSVETSLNNVNESMVRVQELTMQQLNGMQDEEGRNAAIAELEQIRSAVLNSMNTKYEGRYIYSGYQSDMDAFDNAGSYQGLPNQDIEVEIADGFYISMNMTGDEAFYDPDTGKSTIELIDDVIHRISIADEDGLQDLLPEVEAHVDLMLRNITTIGARTSRLEEALSDNEDYKLATTEILSSIEDVDYTEASVRFAEQEQVLEASMQSSAKIMSISILNFLG